jgi:hypothetical protein
VLRFSWLELNVWLQLSGLANFYYISEDVTLKEIPHLYRTQGLIINSAELPILHDPCLLGVLLEVCQRMNQGASSPVSDIYHYDITKKTTFYFLHPSGIHMLMENSDILG